MKFPDRFPGTAAILLTCLCAAPAAALAADLSAWRTVQEIQVPAPGLYRIPLPLETLDACAPGMPDLRLAGPDGFLPLHLTGYTVSVQDPGRLYVTPEVTLQQGRTIATGLTSELERPVTGVTLYIPAEEFLKAVSVETRGTPDGPWLMLVRDRMVFRQENGRGEDLHIPLPVHKPAALRVTLTDSASSPPVPVTTLRLALAPVAPAGETITRTLPIERREEFPGSTRLTCDAGAANTFLESVRIDCDDPVFAAGVRISVAAASGESVSDEVLARGGIMRVAGVAPGSPEDTGVVVPVRTQLPLRRVVVSIMQGDGAPLSGVRLSAVSRPLTGWFSAAAPGALQLCSGNPDVGTAEYDTRALAISSAQPADAAPLTPGPVTPNPQYRIPDSTLLLDMPGAVLFPDEWNERRGIILTTPGVQELELDAAVLATSRPTLSDLRLAAGDRQIPWLVERPDVSRSLTLTPVALLPQKDSISRWRLELPRSGIPLSALHLDCRDPLFQRHLIVRDGDGRQSASVIGTADWVRLPGDAPRPLTIRLTRPPGDALQLETDDGGNAPLTLTHAEAYYPLVRVIFSPPESASDLTLLSGNPEAKSPAYDVQLIARDLLRAPRSVATLTAPLPAPARADAVSGTGPIWLWIVLAGVALLLVRVISRLLPQSPADSPGGE